MQADAQHVLRRLHIAKGQLEGVIKMVEEDRYCIDISNQLMAVIAALRGANREVLSAHLKHCVAGAFEEQNKEEVEQKVAEIAKVVDKLSR